MRADTKSSLRFVGMAAIVAAPLFACDLILPMGVAVGYVMFVFLGFWAPACSCRSPSPHQL